MAIMPSMQTKKPVPLTDPDNQSLYKRKGELIKALAHPTRMYFVDILSSGERCVCELTDLVGADISTVSKHLSVLKSAGIISDRKKGLNVYYHLTCPCAATFFDCIDRLIEGQQEKYSGSKRPKGKSKRRL